ncbi:MAG TPA: dTMP kinase [Acidimicrobiales bacterium]|nr:dTMP kinase [Acidimicrobiales bacterium]
MRGRFIVFEGLDGAGTTTQVARLASWLRSRDVDVETTKEPTTGPIGAVLRQAIEGRVVLDAATLALAFAADRTDHLFNPVNGVARSLDAGRWVVSDRYVLSSLAYQDDGATARSWLREINARALEPDLTIFVDTSVTECRRRLTARSSHAELFDDSLDRTKASYDALLDGLTSPLVRIDGDGDVDRVAEAIAAAVERWVGGTS